MATIKIPTIAADAELERATKGAGAEDAATDHIGIDHEIIAPDGEVVSVTDIDGLIDLYERLDKQDKAIYAAKLAVRESLARLTEGDAKTRRVRGRRRQAKVEMPDDSWEQAILKEAYNSFPQFRDQYLRIGTINVTLREYKKAVNTSGPDDFTCFRDMLTRANRGPTGTPTVKIEV